MNSDCDKKKMGYDYFTIGYRLPWGLTAKLYGDRARHGLKAQAGDPMWQSWQAMYLDHYSRIQNHRLSKMVNNAGYRIMRRIDMSGKRILEIGPGDIRHISNWKGKPECYVAADVSPHMLAISEKVLRANQVVHRLIRLDEGVGIGPRLLGNEQFDLILAFFTFEHIYPLPEFLDQLIGVLKPGGMIVGAIPCEGGMAWGLGRLMTSHRWVKKYDNVDHSKVICWEHPNFADSVLTSLDGKLRKRYLSYWPFVVPIIDVNLVAGFMYQKS
jgi:SAM-dependent methyltransferase